VDFEAMRRKRASSIAECIDSDQCIDLTAVSPYPKFCDGYSRPGQQGTGYVSVLKASCGQCEKTCDDVLDGIVSYDRAEANDGYIGQINMETASSFCGVAGQVWGMDLAFNSVLEHAQPLFVERGVNADGSDLPVYDAGPLFDAGIALFGREKCRVFPPVPGGHVICANKSGLSFRPKDRPPKYLEGVGEGYGVWAVIALSFTKDKTRSADLFIEDTGSWPSKCTPELPYDTMNKEELSNALDAWLQSHRRAVVKSIIACGVDSDVSFDCTFIGWSYIIMDPGWIGTSIACAPYISLAKNAILKNQQGCPQYDLLNQTTLAEWEHRHGPGIDVVKGGAHAHADAHHHDHHTTA